jgi:uncharacterized lipoprotein NlpE involved in copper resistance
MSTQQVSPQLSPTPIAYAPSAESQPNWSNAAPSAGAMPSPVPSMPPGQAMAAQPQPSWDSAAPQWQAAFNQLVGAQTPTQAYQGWAAPSVSTPYGLTQGQAANWVQAPQVASAPQISSPQPTAGLSAADVQYLAAQTAQQTMAAQAQAAQLAQLQAAQSVAQRGDSYLDNISNESLEVLSHFGAEAPVKLNTYACQVEDALLQSLQHQHNQAQALTQQHEYITRVQDVLAAATADREAMLQILTEPDQLSDYTQRFFGPEGPYPIETPAEQAQRSLAEGMVDMNSPLMPYAGNPRMDAGYEQPAPQQFQRPQMPMPNPSGGQRLAGNGNVWNQFSSLMDTNPADAWKVLNQAGPEDVRAKILFMEG